MLTFSPITEANASLLSQYYTSCDYRLSDYSLGIKLMWNDMLASEYTVYAGCLIVRNKVRFFGNGGLLLRKIHFL